MLFPKMLETRPILISGDKIIAGNMRHKALVEIYTLSASELSGILMRSEREFDPDKVINRWIEWKEDPVVDCEESGLSDQEEKELIVKDNMEFGEFDTVKLSENYTKEELVEFGVFEKEEAPVLEPTRPGAKGRKVEKVRFGNYDVDITLEEYEELKEKFDNYTENTGTSYGFITYIRNEKDKN